MRRVNPWILGVGLLGAVPLLVLLVVSFGRDPRAVPSMLEGKPAPAFALQTLHGEGAFDLAELQGRPVVLNFWSTWCQPCKVEHPLLLRAAETYEDVQFLGVVYQDDPVKAKAYLARAGTTYPHLVDPGGAVAVDYGVAGVPETFFIDAEGHVTYKHVGPLRREVLEARLGGP